jgi:hypothetical protein
MVQSQHWCVLGLADLAATPAGRDRCTRQTTGVQSESQRNMTARMIYPRIKSGSATTTRLIPVSVEMPVELASCLRDPKESGVPGVCAGNPPSYREKLVQKCTANYLGASPPTSTTEPPGEKSDVLSSDWSNGIVTPEITPSVTRTLSCFCAASRLLISRRLLVLGLAPTHGSRHDVLLRDLSQFPVGILFFLER